jgi:hypothetical protein
MPCVAGGKQKNIKERLCIPINPRPVCTFDKSTVRVKTLVKKLTIFPVDHLSDLQHTDVQVISTNAKASRADH